MQQFLATDPGVQKLVRDRVGVDAAGVWVDGPPDPEYVKWLKWAQDPKRWVRQSKMKVGSKAYQDHAINPDAEFVQTEFGIDIANGMVRLFWLRGTDHISIVTYEKNNQIVMIDDVSD